MSKRYIVTDRTVEFTDRTADGVVFTTRVAEGPVSTEGREVWVYLTRDQLAALLAEMDRDPTLTRPEVI